MPRPRHPAPSLVKRPPTDDAPAPGRLPTDWKQCVEACIRNCYHAKILPEPSVGQPERYLEDMLIFLKSKKVEQVARELWAFTKDRPGIRGELPGHIHLALYTLASAGRDRPETPPRSEYEKHADFLERERKFIPNKQAREALDRRIRSYCFKANLARITRPKDRGKRAALSSLLWDFYLTFGDPQTKIVGLLMEAQFGGKWSAGAVRARASVWKCWPVPPRTESPLKNL